MGLLKRQWEEEQERGWRSLGKEICVDCVHEPALKGVVDDNAVAGTCSYCGRHSSDALNVCDADDVMEVVGDALHTEYSHPIAELPWDEGEYVGSHFDTWDLLATLGEDIGDAEFVSDIIEAFGATEWCERDYFQTKEDDALTFSWQRFADIVKHERRYLFLRLDTPERYAEAYDVTPAGMLTKIGELVTRHGLLRTLPPGTEIFRGRPHARGSEPCTAAALGTPPRTVALSNRMSPAGIAVFYGAFDRETALAETAPALSNEKPYVSVGRFQTEGETRVVDLASLPEIPSIFDQEAREDRPTIRFLHAFAEIVSRPLNELRAADREIVEYIPTQVVTEYFWHVFAAEHGVGRIGGLLYRSAQRPGGVCCALFIPRENCLEPGAQSPVADAPAIKFVAFEAGVEPPLPAP